MDEKAKISNEAFMFYFECPACLGRAFLLKQMPVPGTRPLVSDAYYEETQDHPVSCENIKCGKCEALVNYRDLLTNRVKQCAGRG